VFLKRIIKKNSNGERKTYYRLCESYRVEDTVRHRSIIQLGTLDALTTDQERNTLVSKIESLIDECRRGLVRLIDETDELIDRMAYEVFDKISAKNSVDLGQGRRFETIDRSTVKNKNIREAGTEWLCAQAIRQLNIEEFLASKGWTESEVKLGITHLISRATYPASELCTSKWIRQNSAVCELTGYPEELITKDKLYGISHKLYSAKDDLEKHLSHRTCELFDLHDSIYIYDLTNTYFEGQYRDSEMLKYGRSKEKRGDCKLIVLANVVNAEGFIKYSQIFEGNKADSKSLLDIITELSSRTSVTGRKPVVVMDAGIATKDNIDLLRSMQFDYMCVSRSTLKKYSCATENEAIIFDKKGQRITLRKVDVEGDPDTYLQVHSCAKELKEESILKKLEERFIQDIAHIQAGLQKKGGIKNYEKIWERIGRVKQKYPRVSKLYEVQVEKNDPNIATNLKWHKRPVAKREGYYFLRTSLKEIDEETQWRIYNTIREIESTFRSLKSDLDLRPVYHKTDAATMAHLNLGLLAYTVVNTIRYQLKQKGIHNEWKDLTRIMNTQKMVTTTMVNKQNQTVIIRQFSEPIADVQDIYAALRFKPKPFRQLKFVVPPESQKNDEDQQNRQVRYG
jgi:hypothetical protein